MWNFIQPVQDIRAGSSWLNHPFERLQRFHYFCGMKLKRPNKMLLEQIRKTVNAMRCPLHGRQAMVSMDSESEPVQVEACCKFFKEDVTIVAERMRKDFLYKAEKTRERLERERKSGSGRNDEPLT
jgi:hypothetical protein